MKLFSLEENSYPKTLLVLAAIFLVASGLCGVQVALVDKMPDNLGAILIPLGVVELSVMLLSGGAFVFILVLWPAQALYIRFAKPSKDGVQRLFDETEDPKSDDSR